MSEWWQTDTPWSRCTERKEPPVADKQRFVPTPEEIAEECAKIREGWSKERWERQKTNADRGWMPPVIGSKSTRDISGTGESRGND